MCYCTSADYTVNEASILSKYGVTAVEFFNGYLYIGGSYERAGTADDVNSPVFGYGTGWVFNSKRL